MKKPRFVATYGSGLLKFALNTCLVVPMAANLRTKQILKLKEQCYISLVYEHICEIWYFTSSGGDS